MSDGLVIDCFCGAGGASEGLRQFFGRAPDIAVNHDETAIKIHQSNYPNTLCLTEDIFKADLAGLVNRREVALLWASPDCRHFSKARGGKPTSDSVRMLPWAVYKHARALRPRMICCENVEEIKTWEDYARWVDSMVGLGYAYESRELTASDYGSYTSRRRWFAVFRLDGRPVRWPLRTHARRRGQMSLGEEGLEPWKRIRDILDFTDVGEEVRHRKRPLADKTMKRLSAGNELFGTTWLMQYYGNSVGQSVDEPLRTITTHDRFALVTNTCAGTYLRMLRVDELKRAQGFPDEYNISTYPDGTRIPRVVQTNKIGNSVVPLMARKLVEANVVA